MGNQLAGTGHSAICVTRAEDGYLILGVEGAPPRIFRDHKSGRAALRRAVAEWASSITAEPLYADLDPPGASGAEAA